MAGYQRYRQRKVHKLRLLNILSTSILFFLFNVTATAQIPEVEASSMLKIIATEIPEGPTFEGQRIQLLYRIPRAENAKPDLRFDLMPNGMQVVSVPEYRFEEGYGDDGQRIREVIARIFIRVTVPGWTVVPAAYFTFSPSEMYQSKPLAIGIALNGTKGAVPPELEWEVPNGPVYAGQSIQVYLYANKVKTLSIPRSIGIQVIQGFSLQEVPGTASNKQFEIAGQKFLRVPIASYILTPSSAAKLNIPSLAVQFEEYVRYSPPFSLEVSSLPPELALSGAVGTYRRSIINTSESLVIGKSFSLSEILEGRGNLPFVRLADPMLDGLEIQSKDETSRMEAGTSGFNGVRERHFNLVATRSGAVSISWPAFNYFDPETGTISQIKAESLQFNVSKIATISMAINDPFPGFGSSNSIANSNRELPLYIWLVLFLGIPALVWFGTRKNAKITISLAGVLLLALVLALFAENQNHGNTQAKAETIKDLASLTVSNKSYAQIVNRYQDSVLQYPNSAELWLDLAHARFLNTEFARSYYAVEQASRLLPQNAEIAKIKLFLEDHLGLAKEALPEITIPNALFWVLALGLIFVAALLLRRRNVPYRLFLGLLSALLAFLLAGVQLYSFSLTMRPWGVVNESGAVLKRIPEQEAAEWIAVPPGTNVWVVAEYQNFALVETIYHVKGWTEKKAILSSNNLYNSSTP